MALLTTLHALLVQMAALVLLAALLLLNASVRRTFFDSHTVMIAFLVPLSVLVQLAALILIVARVWRTLMALMVFLDLLYALLVPLAVLVLLAACILLNACVRRTPMAPLTTLNALLALLVLLPMVMESLPSLIASARLTRMEMLKLFLLFLLVELFLCALHVISVAPTALKHQQPILCLLLACAQSTHTLPQVPRAHSALLTLRPLPGVLLPQQLHKLLAPAMPTPMEMPRPIHALLVLMVVSSLLKPPMLPLKLLIVYAQPTPMQPMESVPLVDAPLVELVQPLLRDPFRSLNVHALQTPTVALRHASLALMAPDLLQVPPTQPLPLLFVFARLTTTENPLTVALFVPVVAPGMPPPSLLAAPAKSPLKTASVL